MRTSQNHQGCYERKFADFLTLRRKKKKTDDGSGSLEKQAWFHGKINAEYAEMLLKKSGEFLVREDPAMPGAWFIAVRTKDVSLHLAINKLKSSKGNRFKYRIEDSDFVFDSISELIRFYVNERRPVCIRPPAVVTIAVSREAALLSEEDFRGRFATAGSARLNRATRKLERKSSDPNLSTRVPSRLYEEIDPPPVEDRPGPKFDPPKMAVNGIATLKNERRRKSEEHSIPTSPRSRSMDNVLDDTSNNSKDWAENSMNSTYDSPRSIPVPLSPSFKTPFTQQEKKRKNLDPSLFESDVDYATPSSIPVSRDDEVSRDMNYDIPRYTKMTEGSRNLINDENDHNTNYVNHIDPNSQREGTPLVDNEPQPMAQNDRHNLYLTVVNKLRDAIVLPFMRHDCVTLARHLTKADLEVVWNESNDEDDDGGAKGLEKVVLPQGREKRCAILDR
ncbi:hypothetical protein QZH41_004448 [Actinostola sp. cb2023]|nr:hypothetical protein QZH41_004448 [Actinostola sp. cb2023]